MSKIYFKKKPAAVEFTPKERAVAVCRIAPPTCLAAAA